MRDQIELLANRLMADGHVDNEPDARLAAIHIILASERHSQVAEQPVEELVEAE